MNAEPRVVLWVIYDHPLDFPNRWVVRRQGISPDGTVQIMPEMWFADSIGESRAILKRVAPGAVCLGRSDGDEPQIAEVWI